MDHAEKEKLVHLCSVGELLARKKIDWHASVSHLSFCMWLPWQKFLPLTYTVSSLSSSVSVIVLVQEGRTLCFGLGFVGFYLYIFFFREREDRCKFW